MKPCLSQRKRIALFQAGALPEAEAIALRDHLQNCAACRRHAQELADLCGDLRQTAAALPEIEPSGTFHARLLSRIQSEPSPSAWLLDWVKRLAWPAAGLASAAAVIFVLMLAEAERTASHSGMGEPSNPSPPLDAPSPAWDQPSYSNYRQAAVASLDKLDRLLEVQATYSATSKEVFTAGQHRWLE